MTLSYKPIFDECFIYEQTRWLVFTSKMFEKHLWTSDILRKDAGHRPASILKMSLFHRCFSNILLAETNKWNIGWKWVKIKHSPNSCSQSQCHNFADMVEDKNSEVGWFTLFLVLLTCLFLAWQKMFTDKIHGNQCVICFFIYLSPSHL